jgi:hypothetical protein
MRECPKPLLVEDEMGKKNNNELTKKSSKVNMNEGAQRQESVNEGRDK